MDTGKTDWESFIYGVGLQFWIPCIALKTSNINLTSVVNHCYGGCMQCNVVLKTPCSSAFATLQPLLQMEGKKRLTKLERRWMDFATHCNYTNTRVSNCSCYNISRRGKLFRGGAPLSLRKRQSDGKVGVLWPMKHLSGCLSPFYSAAMH